MAINNLAGFFYTSSILYKMGHISILKLMKHNADETFVFHLYITFIK